MERSIQVIMLKRKAAVLRSKVPGRAAIGVGGGGESDEQNNEACALA